jgi:hypothetical protein
MQTIKNGIDPGYSDCDFITFLRGPFWVFYAQELNEGRFCMNRNVITIEITDTAGAICTKPFDAETARHADGDDPCNRGEN